MAIEIPFSSDEPCDSCGAVGSYLYKDGNWYCPECLRELMEDAEEDSDDEWN